MQIIIFPGKKCVSCENWIICSIRGFKVCRKNKHATAEVSLKSHTVSESLSRLQILKTDSSSSRLTYSPQYTQANRSLNYNWVIFTFNYAHKYNITGGNNIAINPCCYLLLLPWCQQCFNFSHEQLCTHHHKMELSGSPQCESVGRQDAGLRYHDNRLRSSASKFSTQWRISPYSFTTVYCSGSNVVGLITCYRSVGELLLLQ